MPLQGNVIRLSQTPKGCTKLTIYALYGKEVERDPLDKNIIPFFLSLNFLIKNCYLGLESPRLPIWGLHVSLILNYTTFLLLKVYVGGGVVGLSCVGILIPLKPHGNCV